MPDSPSMPELIAAAERGLPWLLDNLEALVRAESPSTDKTAVDRCGAILETRLRGLGARVERLAQTAAGDHVRARFGSGRARPILLLGHFDTVWAVGELAAMPCREVGGRLHGPGIYDMKAGIAVAMLAVRLLQEAGAAPDVAMLWTSDEEIGSGTSRAAIEEEALRSRAVLVLEPSLPGGGVKTSRKGCGGFEVTVHGVAAHAGVDPGRGANAIHELAHQILAIAALQDPARGISVNVNVVEGGGRTNVIADRARASVDARAPTQDAAREIESAMRALATRNPSTRIEVRGGFSRPPLEAGPHVRTLYEMARAVSAEAGRVLPEGGTGGGSDGNFTAALGVPTLDGLGPEGDGAHARHEHVVLRDLPWRAAFLARLLSRLAEAEVSGEVK